jgi:sister-chromatid-cohesion protein PDS5
LLQDIFTLFIVQILPTLSDPSNAYNTQHKYVLVSLAEVKSIVLLMDIPGSDHLTLHLFSSFFDALSGSPKTSSGEQIAKDIQYHMTQILVTLVDEAESLPAQVVDIIVAQFLRATTPGAGKTKETQNEKQSTLLLKELPEAYGMAKTICNSCPEKMARYISQYFNDVILDVSASSSNGPKTNGHRRQSEAMGSDDEDAPIGPTEADMKELQKAHRLLRELWRASPAVLQNVIPQLEAELSAESVQLRLLATETLGDIISGIGAAGPPPPPTMDPAAYPPVRIDDDTTSTTSNILTTPISPQSFAQTHPNVYQSFLGRKNDKSLVIRTGWTTAVGRILVTSAGGIGLSREDETSLVKGLGEKLCDSDEKVRLAAVKAIAGFNLRDVMTKLAPNGDVSTSGSILSNLADRARDRKNAIRIEAMTTLGRIWGVATGEITSGNDSVIAALGEIPTRIVDAYYANDPELNVLLDRVLFEQLIPLSYPPKKVKGKANGTSQTPTTGDSSFDTDKIRTERILLVVKSLNTRSKKAFFAMQARQSTYSNALTGFLKRCEEYNGGVMDENAKDIKLKLEGMIKWIAALLPDPLRVTSELQKFAKMHDRRSYQLLRFAMASESDFKTVYNSIKEFSKRIESAPTAPVGLLDTLIPIIYRSASLVYNKSHLPAIMQYSRSDDSGLGAAAHELNHEISEKMPDIFKSNVVELCNLLEDDVPSPTKINDVGSVETLRDLAQFASGVSRDLPKDRKFIQTLVSFALYSTPPKAAKYAVSILVAATDRKEMHMKELLQKAIQDWTYGEDHFLTKLTTMSQLTLLDPKVTADFEDEILDITTKQILLQVRTPINNTDRSWQPASEIDEECEAKCWALKVLVNRLRSTEDVATAKKTAIPVYKLLNSLVNKEGEISKNNDTPRHHKSRLRLLAAQLILKLCRSKAFDDILSPTDFIRLACVAQDPLTNIRRGFVEKVQKYLVKGKLSNRFYAIIFLTAFEPNIDFKKSIVTWIRSQAKVLPQRTAQVNVMESIFPRFLSLLAHHPDYAPDSENLKDHARYILYYLNSVASEENLGLVYKYAERVKQARDGINIKVSERLYVLSDLAQAVIRKWELKKGWRMQTYPAKLGLPLGLFTSLPSHEIAQEIAEKDFLPDGMEEILDGVVRSSDKVCLFFYLNSNNQLTLGLAHQA